MKCPICGQDLRPSKKDPNYYLCYECKKKFKVPKRKEQREDEAEQKYSNIPPKHVRKKREDEMRKAYDEMLSAGDAKKSQKKKAKPKAKPKPQEEIDDDFFDDNEEEKMSKAPIIILGIAIIVVAALIVYMLLR